MLTATGVSVNSPGLSGSGTRARLTALLEYIPLIPGPLKKIQKYH